MSVMQSKSSRLADYLRDCIYRGELIEPLPGTIPWSKRLGVARMTLVHALNILSEEGLVTIHPRGTRLNREKIRALCPAEPSLRLIRMLYYTHDYPSLSNSSWVLPLIGRFRDAGFRIEVEPCDDIRLRGIIKQKSTGKELFFLISLPQKYQQLFQQSGKAAIVIGELGDGVSLPVTGADQIGAVRHATHFLLRRRVQRLHFLIAGLSSPGIEESIRTFESTCQSWPDEPVQGRMVKMPLSTAEDTVAARRFATRVGENDGVIIVGPIHPSLIMMALLERGVRIPQQVSVMAILPPFPEMRLCPKIPIYQMDTNRYIKQMLRIAEAYFGSGRLPSRRDKLPLELRP